MLRISKPLQSLLISQTRNYARQLGAIMTPQRAFILLQPRVIFKPQTRFIRRALTIKMPKFVEGKIQWIKNTGDYVEEYELVAKIKSDKCCFEVRAQYSGKISEILVDDGSLVKAKQKLYKFQKIFLSEKVDIAAAENLEVFIDYEKKYLEFRNSPRVGPIFTMFPPIISIIMLIYFLMNADSWSN